MQTSPYFWFQKEICIPWIHLRSNSTISPVSLWCVMLPTREHSAMWQQSLSQLWLIVTPLVDFTATTTNKSSLKLIVCQLLLYYTETWLPSNKNLSLLVLQALKQQSQGAAHPPLLQFWKPDGPKCNCFNGGKGEGILKDWLRDLVSRWTNQRGSQGHSQGAKTNKYTCLPALSPVHFCTHKHFKNKNPPQVISHLAVFSASSRARAPAGLEPITSRTVQMKTHRLLTFINIRFHWIGPQVI